MSSIQVATGTIISYPSGASTHWEVLFDYTISRTTKPYHVTYSNSTDDDSQKVYILDGESTYNYSLSNGDKFICKSPKLTLNHRDGAWTAEASIDFYLNFYTGSERKGRYGDAGLRFSQYGQIVYIMSGNTDPYDKFNCTANGRTIELSHPSKTTSKTITSWNGTYYIKPGYTFNKVWYSDKELTTKWADAGKSVSVGASNKTVYPGWVKNPISWPDATVSVENNTEEKPIPIPESYKGTSNSSGGSGNYKYSLKPLPTKLEGKVSLKYDTTITTYGTINTSSKTIGLTRTSGNTVDGKVVDVTSPTTNDNYVWLKFENAPVGSYDIEIEAEDLWTGEKTTTKVTAEIGGRWKELDLTKYVPKPIDTIYNGIEQKLAEDTPEIISDEYNISYTILVNKTRGTNAGQYTTVYRLTSTVLPGYVDVSVTSNILKYDISGDMVSIDKLSDVIYPVISLNQNSSDISLHFTRGDDTTEIINFNEYSYMLDEINVPSLTPEYSSSTSGKIKMYTSSTNFTGIKSVPNITIRRKPIVIKLILGSGREPIEINHFYGANYTPPTDLIDYGIFKGVVNWLYKGVKYSKGAVINPVDDISELYPEYLNSLVNNGTNKVINQIIVKSDTGVELVKQSFILLEDGLHIINI